MPTSTYAYSPGAGSSFHIEVTGKPFGAAASESEGQEEHEEEVASQVEVEGPRGAWLLLLRRAVDTALRELDALTPEKGTLKKLMPEVSGGLNTPALDWRSPSDVSTEIPCSPTTDSGAQLTPSPAIARPTPTPLQEGGGEDEAGERLTGRRRRVNSGSGSPRSPPERFEVNVAGPYFGVQYRRSKCLEDVDPSRFAENGTHVAGHLEDEGAWLRTKGGLYLPVVLGDERALRPTKGSTVAPSLASEGGLFSWTCCARSSWDADPDPFLVQEEPREEGVVEPSE